MHPSVCTPGFGGSGGSFDEAFSGMIGLGKGYVGLVFGVPSLGDIRTLCIRMGPWGSRQEARKKPGGLDLIHQGGTHPALLPALARSSAV